MKRATIVSCVLLSATLVGGSAVADDLTAPGWRGNYSTTSQVWDFRYKAGVSAPYIYDPDGPAVGGQPPLDDTQLTVSGGAWNHPDPFGSSRLGMWLITGEYMEVFVENHEPPNDFKWVLVQITWQETCGCDPLALEALDPAPVGPPELISEIPLDYGWIHSTYEWRIEPNPQWESFRIVGAAIIDEVIVDTWCIPEPASASLLLTAGVVALIRRRKRS